MATRQRERALKNAENADKRPRAIAKNLGVSPSKVRTVLNLIRGKDYTVAVAMLKNMPNVGAEYSVKANLYVAECYADGAATLKRFQPVSKGRAHSIKKRTSHITIILDEKKA